MAVNGPGRPVRGQRSRVLISPRRPPLDPLVFISISTNFSSRRALSARIDDKNRRGGGGGGQRKSFGCSVRLLVPPYPFLSRANICTRPWIRIMPTREGDGSTLSLSSDLSSINIPWTVFQKRHAQGFPKYLRSLCKKERNEIVLASLLSPPFPSLPS